MEDSQIQNPYSAPATTDAPPVVPTDALYYREGDFLMIRDGAVLPARCIKTNLPAEPKDWTKQVQLTWTPPWIYIFLPFAVLPVLIIAAIISKRAKLTYTLCREERSRVMKRKTFATLGIFAGIGTIFACFFAVNGNTSAILAIIGVVLMIGSLVVIAVTNAITVRKHRDGWFTIKGCRPEFLNSL